jgi:hypothetical protein
MPTRRDATIRARTLRRAAVDVVTLYMLVKLANGVEYTVMEAPLRSNVACIRTARSLRRGKIAAHYRRTTGGKVLVYCAPLKKHIIIAR